MEEDSIAVEHAKNALVLDPLGGPSEPGQGREEVVAEEAVDHPGTAGASGHGIGNYADESFAFGEKGYFVENLRDIYDLVEEGGGPKVEGLGYFHHGWEGPFASVFSRVSPCCSCC